MPKVSEINITIKDTSYKIPVNCNSDGLFSANIPQEVAEALRIDEKVKANTLSDLTADIDEKLNKYKEANTQETLHILISYHARGRYKEKKDGSVLFSDVNNVHSISISFSEIINAMGFDFMVAIKQVIDGKEKFFEAKLGSEFMGNARIQCAEPNIYHKYTSISNHRMQRYKIIPFSEVALKTLQNGEEKIREASEMLYKFISQDEEQILLTLTNQKLLK